MYRYFRSLNVLYNLQRRNVRLENAQFRFFRLPDDEIRSGFHHDSSFVHDVFLLFHLNDMLFFHLFETIFLRISTILNLENKRIARIRAEKSTRFY